ncbi:MULTISPECIES: hypothetical protein [unclassified Bradyrhizobium]|uniref:hypothetical protein n=1 Tax=unclassified Bradyrhizobium TaxID=2631580 RepID=UPI002FF05BCD
MTDEAVALRRPTPSNSPDSAKGSLSSVVSLAGNCHNLHSVYLNQHNKREIICSWRQSNSTLEGGYLFLCSRPKPEHRIHWANGDAVRTDPMQIQTELWHRAHTACKLDVLRLKSKRRRSIDIEREDFAFRLLQFSYALRNSQLKSGEFRDHG